jgi:hypothetical protein
LRRSRNTSKAPKRGFAKLVILPFETPSRKITVFDHLNGDHPHIWGKDELIQKRSVVSLLQMSFQIEKK